MRSFGAAGWALPAAVFVTLGVICQGCCPRVPQPYSASDLAMDTVVTITAWGGPGQAKLQEAVEAALQEIRRVERISDAHDPGSEVGLLNQAAGRAVPISLELYEMLVAAKEVSAKSEGAFDVTVMPLTMLWGVGRKGDFVPEPDQVQDAMRKVGHEKLQLWVEGSDRWAKLSEGMAVDLGGIAKGYAAGKAKEILSGRGVKGALIDAGGDICVMGDPPGARSWRIAVRHPREPGAYLGVVETFEGAVATSGDYERFFEKGVTRYHHLIDPRTGYPAADCASVTVAGPEPMLVDALSTAVFILGPEGGGTLLDEFPGYDVLMVRADLSLTLTEGMERLFRPGDDVRS